MKIVTIVLLCLFAWSNAITWEFGNYTLPEPRYGAEAISIDNSLMYIFRGGYDGISGEADTVLFLDTNVADPQWEILPVTVPYAFDIDYITNTNNLIWFFNGYDSLWHIFDINTGTFSSISASGIPYYTIQPGITSNGNDALYVIGGRDFITNDVASYIQQYNITSDEWTVLTTTAPYTGYRLNSMYYPPFNYIYIFGGVDPAAADFRTMYYFDLNTNTWSSLIGTFPFWGWSTSSVFIEELDMIYIICRYDQTAVVSFNPITETIATESFRLNGQCSGPTQVGILEGRIHLFGGWQSGGGIGNYLDTNCRTEQLFQTMHMCNVKQINWNEIAENYTNAPDITISLNIDQSELLFDILVEVDYVGSSIADIFNTDGYGTTYVLDFEPFISTSSSINNPGLCSNRQKTSFNNITFTKWWEYS
eukprot:13502_1